MAELTFKEVQRAVLQRTNDSFHPLDAWSTNDYALCLAGESGEMAEAVLALMVCAHAGKIANILKKVRRIEDGEERAYNIGVDATKLKWDAAKEFVDQVIYGLMLLERMEIDVDEAVRLKFNEVSKRVGSQVTL